MKSGRAALVYNPRAGRVLRERPRFETTVEILRETWPSIRLLETTGPRTAGLLARAAARDGADVIIACGGDGTVNEVSQSLAGTGVPLAIIPGGTANVLANEIGLGNDMPSAARALADSVPHDLASAVVRQNGVETTFLLMAGIGFDAMLVHELDVVTKEKWGKLAYWGIALKQLRRRLCAFDVVVDGRTFRSTFTIVSRVRNYGGDVAIARGASLLRDDFEIVVFLDVSVARLAWLLVTGVVTRTLHRKADVRVLRGRHVECKSADEPVPVQVDGEAAGFLPATMDVVPESIRLLLPRRWLDGELRRIGQR